MNHNNVRVRFAPSPTGFLHIGGVRTALFNWLFARKMGGSFILRIENTDEKRSTVESLHAILDGLSWLGLDWDEGPVWGKKGEVLQEGDRGPYFQMERLSLYAEWVKRLKEKGRIYPCWCTKEELDRMRAQSLARKKPLRYDGRCRNLAEAEKEDRFNKKVPYVLRFHVNNDDTAHFTDIIHGPKEFSADQLEDFVVIKSTGGPTYNFACVVDDHVMGITHVIRGDDHLSNTPRQVLLYRTLGLSLPQFAHLPMIMGQDGGRLSKRHGATSLTEYMKAGYLPEAMVNYFALLGWSTQDSQQLFQRDELIQKFSLERCSRSSSIFDPQKLIWMNGEYIRSLSVQDLVRRSLPWLKEENLFHEGDDSAGIEKAIKLEQEKIKRLDDVPRLIKFLVTDEIEYEKDAITQWMSSDESLVMLSELKDILENVTDFSSKNIEETVRSFAKKKGIKNPRIFHPLRVAVSGRTRGPSLFEMLSLLGRERVLTRLSNIRSVTGGKK